MKFKFSIFFIITIVLLNCSKNQSQKNSTIESVWPIKVGTQWIYKNLIYFDGDTVCIMDTVSIIGEYKNYFIEKEVHEDWIGLNLVKYENERTLICGEIKNSDTTIFEIPTVTGFMDGTLGFVDKNILLENENLKCYDSLTVSSIPDYQILNTKDTVYRHYFSSTCPGVSHRYSDYSKKFGHIKTTAFRRDNGEIVQEIILVDIIKPKK